MKLLMVKNANHSESNRIKGTIKFSVLSSTVQILMYENYINYEVISNNFKKK